MDDLVSYLGNFWNNIFIPLKEDYYRKQDRITVLNKCLREKDDVIEVLVYRHNEYESLTNKQEKELIKLRRIAKIYKEKKKEEPIDLTKTQSYTDMELLQLENARLRKQNKALLEKVKRFEKKRLINK